MNISVIPWRAFLDALLRQQPQTLEPWLRRWLFTNEGVIMATEELLRTDTLKTAGRASQGAARESQIF